MFPIDGAAEAIFWPNFNVEVFLVSDNNARRKLPMVGVITLPTGLSVRYFSGHLNLGKTTDKSVQVSLEIAQHKTKELQHDIGLCFSIQEVN